MNCGNGMKSMLINDKQMFNLKYSMLNASHANFNRNKMLNYSTQYLWPSAIILADFVRFSFRLEGSPWSLGFSFLHEDVFSIWFTTSHRFRDLSLRLHIKIGILDLSFPIQNLSFNI